MEVYATEAGKIKIYTDGSVLRAGTPFARRGVSLQIGREKMREGAISGITSMGQLTREEVPEEAEAMKS
jgi:hypothetical protein